MSYRLGFALSNLMVNPCADKPRLADALIGQQPFSIAQALVQVPMAASHVGQVFTAIAEGVVDGIKTVGDVVAEVVLLAKSSLDDAARVLKALPERLHKGLPESLQTQMQAVIASANLQATRHYSALMGEPPRQATERSHTLG